MPLTRLWMEKKGPSAVVAVVAVVCTVQTGEPFGAEKPEGLQE